MVARSPNTEWRSDEMAKGAWGEHSPMGQVRLDNKEDETTVEQPRICLPENGDGARLKHLLDTGQHHAAEKELRRILDENPDDKDGQFFLARLLIDTANPEFAYPVAVALTQKYPAWHQSWFLLGVSETHLRRPEKAIAALKRAIRLKDTPLSHAIMASAYVMAHDLDRAKREAEIALQNADPAWAHMAHVPLAFYHLHRREWQEGWYHYTFQMGRTNDRNIHNYGLNEWFGVGSVLIYGEQGLGDQLCYTSAIDVRCKQLVCHPKLKNLLQRSLDIPVYGDQFQKEIDWPVIAEHQCSMATAMQWQEVKRRGRWLKPHPDKSVQWDALLTARERYKGAKRIGLAWTGGRSHREKEARKATLDTLKPILDLPYNFVSLEYNPHEYIPNVYQWGWATQTDDLDDFVALVDNLDHVISVPTTTYHIAGSLGIPCDVLVHKHPHFHEGIEGDSPWWESVSFHRGSQEKAVAAIADGLKNT